MRIVIALLVLASLTSYGQKITISKLRFIEGSTTVEKDTTTVQPDFTIFSNFSSGKVRVWYGGTKHTMWPTAGSGGVSGSGTTNQIAYWTSSTALGSLTTATYPSLTELSYVKGVTAPIETHFWKTTGNTTLLGSSSILGGGSNLINLGTSGSRLAGLYLYSNDLVDLNSTSGSNSGDITFQPTGVTISNVTSAGSTSFDLFNSLGYIAVGSTVSGFSGIRYSNDYSANYATRSLVDKGYVDGAFQPLDADLTSWAAVTRASGFDTWVATPSSANLRSLLTDELGTGVALFEGGARGLNGTYTATGNITDAFGTNTWGITSSGTTTNFATITANSLTTATALTIQSTSLTTGPLAKFISTSTVGNDVAGTNARVMVDVSGANSTSGKTVVGLMSKVANTGTTSVNIPAYFTGNGATTNYGSYSIASGGTIAYGIYASAANATTNWSGYFDGTGNSSGTILINTGLSTGKSQVIFSRAFGATDKKYWTVNTIAAEAANVGSSLVISTLNDSFASITDVLSVTRGGGFTFTQANLSSLWIPIITIQPGTLTALTTATEFNSLDSKGATWTWVDGTVATQRFAYFRAFTLNKTTTSATFTDTYRAYFEKSVAGSGVTLTNNYAAGFDGDINLISTTSALRVNGSAGTSGQVLTSAGAGATPTWNSSITISGRLNKAQGADVASVAGAIALGTDGNSFEITGTNAITLISNTSWQNGSQITLLFTSTATLTDGTANSGTDIGMELSGNANFVASSDDTITLVLSEIGGVQRWREVSRTVN